MNDPTAQAALDRATSDDNRLLLLYQPIHDAKSRVVRAAEALLRQQRAGGEIREASIITEAAEESQGPELLLLDSMVLRRAFEDAGRWQTRRDVRLNVNLSPREFEEGNVIERLTALVHSFGIDTSLVNLEITETRYIAQPEETMDVLLELRKLGLSLWLDDFGTGHSSLTHLQRFPVDGIKLPGDFVRPLPGDARSARIVRGLIDLAHDLGMQVVAEEVETEEQLELLTRFGCDLIQGFLFSRPMAADEFEQLLARG